VAKPPGPWPYYRLSNLQGIDIERIAVLQKWPGEAKVHVSLVNWAKQDHEGPFILDGVAVSGIDSSLHVNAPDAWTPLTLLANKGKCFQGPIPVGAGFILTEDEARGLLACGDVDYSEVVRRYLTSRKTQTSSPVAGSSTSARSHWNTRRSTQRRWTSSGSELSRSGTGIGARCGARSGGGLARPPLE